MKIKLKYKGTKIELKVSKLLKKIPVEDIISYAKGYDMIHAGDCDKCNNRRETYITDYDDAHLIEVLESRNYTINETTSVIKNRRNPSLSDKFLIDRFDALMGIKSNEEIDSMLTQLEK